LIFSKGVFPYKYVDCVEKLEDTRLPSCESFFSSLTGDTISESDYAHAANGMILYSRISIYLLSEWSVLENWCLVINRHFRKFRRSSTSYVANYNLDLALHLVRYHVRSRAETYAHKIWVVYRHQYGFIHRARWWPQFKVQTDTHRLITNTTHRNHRRILYIMTWIICTDGRCVNRCHTPNSWVWQRLTYRPWSTPTVRLRICILCCNNPLQMMLVFVHVRRQQYALVLLHIVFCRGDRREFSWKSTKNRIYHRTIDNYDVRVIHAEMFIAQHQSILV